MLFQRDMHTISIKHTFDFEYEARARRSKTISIGKQRFGIRITCSTRKLNGPINIIFQINKSRNRLERLA